jgi:pimeloyl-ACP methyl ester carboxylesterase
MPPADPAARAPVGARVARTRQLSPVDTVVTDDGVSLSVRVSVPSEVAGPASLAPPVIVFVHGFPDDAHIWAGVMAALSGEATLVAYDVRGAGASGAPADRSAYRIDRLAADLRDVVDTVSPDVPVHLVAHDWGSTQVFHALGTTLTGRVASYTSISGPDLGQARSWIRRQVRGGPRGWGRLLRQGRSSAYIAAFVLPGPVDLATRLGIVGRLVTRDPSRLGAHVSRADVRHGLNVYRANLLGRAPAGPAPGIEVPVQVIAPTADRYVRADVQTDLRGIAELSVVPIDAGHWVMLSHPVELADRIRVFVRDTAKRRQ